MPGGYSQQLLDEIRSRVDIVELVGQCREAQAHRGELEGALSLPHREDAVVHRQPEAGHLSLLRLRRGRRRLQLPHAPGAARVPRGGARARRARRRGPARRGRSRAPRRTASSRRCGAAMALAAEFYSRSLWEAGRREGARVPRAARRRCRRSRGASDSATRRRAGTRCSGVMAPAGHRRRPPGPGRSRPRRARTGRGFYDRFRGRLLFPDP